MDDNLTCLEVENFNVGLDWATFSAGASELDRKRFYDFGVAYMQGFSATRREPEKARVRDYEGTRISDTYFVKRPSDGHLLLIASGDESNQLAEEVIKCDVPTVPTRLDIQATARTAEPNPDYPAGLRNAILRAREAQGRKQRQIMAVFEHQAGFTGLSLGSRSSEIYGRIYDWHAKHAGHHSFRLWRHELEYKGGAAKRLWQSYKAGNEPERVIVATMAERFDRWGIPAPWLPDMGRLSVMQERKVSDTEKRLKYLNDTVAPMLAKLVAEGKTVEILAVLQKHGIMQELLSTLIGSLKVADVTKGKE